MRLLKWLLSLVVILVLVALLLPLAGKFYVKHRAEQAGYQADIGSLGINWFTGTLSLGGLKLEHPKGANLEMLSGSAEFKWNSLFSSHPTITKLVLSHVSVDIDNQGQETKFAGVTSQALGKLLGDKILKIQYAEIQFLELCRDTQQQCLKVDETIVSRLEASFAQAWTIHHDGPLRVQKAILQKHGGESALIFAEALHIQSGRWQSDKVSLGEITATNWQLLETSPIKSSSDAMLQIQLGELLVQSLYFKHADASQLQLGEMEITSLRQGITNYKPDLGAKIRDNMSEWLPWVSDAISAAEQGQLAWSTQSIEVRDGTFAWADYRVSPAALENVNGFKMSLSAMDSGQPAKASRITTSFRFARDGLLKLEGDVFPFMDDGGFLVEGILQDLQLASFTAYTQGWFGQTLHSGVVDVGFKLSYRNRQLEGNTYWRLTQLRAEKETVSGQRMPIALAFEILQDHNQSVPFELELDTQVDSQSQSLRAMYQKIHSTLSAKAQQQLNEAGAVAMHASSDKAAIMEFRPLIYGANDHLPRAEDRSQLDDVVKLLKGKTHLSMVFCPVTTGGEWAELFNQGQLPEPGVEIPAGQYQVMVNLAKTRGQALRTMLIDKGLESGQIVLCGPAVDMQKTGASYISVSL